MLRVSGLVQQGFGHFRRRMTDFAELFTEATGESLYPGTLNVIVESPLPIKEHFRIKDPMDENQDLLFEICRANGLWAYRIRPLNIRSGEGGHGDATIEIACSQEIPNVGLGKTIDIEFFR